MKPLLSENGSIELMFGGLGLVAFFFSGARDFEAALLLIIGVVLLAYGISLRKSWNDRARARLDEMDRQSSDQP